MHLFLCSVYKNPFLSLYRHHLLYTRTRLIFYAFVLVFLTVHASSFFFIYNTSPYNSYLSQSPSAIFFIYYYLSFPSVYIFLFQTISNPLLQCYITQPYIGRTPPLRSNQKIKTNGNLQLPSHMRTQHTITAKSTQKQQAANI